MGLFRNLFGLKKEDKSTGCSCNNNIKENASCSCSKEEVRENNSCCCSKGEVNEEKTLNCKCENSSNNKKILILGPGCKNCITLEKNTNDAVKKMNLSLEVGHITDFAEIAKYGVMSTPAIVYNEEVVSYGRVLSVDEIIELFEKLNIKG